MGEQKKIVHTMYYKGRHQHQQVVFNFNEVQMAVILNSEILLDLLKKI